MKAVAFLFRHPEILFLFPEVTELYSLDNQCYTYWDKPIHKQRFYRAEKARLSELMLSLGYTEQDTTDEVWSFADPITRQTYYHFLKIHGDWVQDVPSSLKAQMAEAHVLFNDMVMPHTCLEWVPRVHRIVTGATNHYLPDPEDNENYDFLPLTDYLWNNPTRIQHFTAFHLMHNYPYHKRNVTRDMIRSKVLLSSHPSIEQLYHSYQKPRQSYSDSESELDEQDK